MDRVLQGFFDASGKGAEDIFVLAGLISTEDRWQTFSNEWILELNGGPERKRQPIKVFKLKNFDLTSTRQLNRCAFFQRIAHEHAIGRVAVIVDAAATRRAIQNSWWSKFLDKSIEPRDSAYWFAFRALNEAFNMLRRDKPELGLTGPMEFTFDDERKSDRLALVSAWKYLLKTSPSEKRAKLGKMPSFSRDDLVLPLQAADMVAGLARKISSSGQSIKGLPTPWSSEGRKPIWTITMEYGEADIRRNLERVVESQIRKRYWRSLA